MLNELSVQLAAGIEMSTAADALDQANVAWSHKSGTAEGQLQVAPQGMIDPLEASSLVQPLIEGGLIKAESVRPEFVNPTTTRPGSD